MAEFGSYLAALPEVVFDRDLVATVLVLAATLTLVSLFIFNFYKSLSKRNLLSLNLYKYNTSDHPLTNKVFAMLFYMLEYILFMPFLIMLWFAGLAIILLLIAKDGQGIDYILWIVAAMIVAIRILAYIKSEISVDLAKLFPFITLSVFVLAPGDFDLAVIIENLKVVPSLFNHIVSYLLVIFFVEIVMRLLHTLYEFWRSEEGAEEEEQ